MAKDTKSINLKLVESYSDAKNERFFNSFFNANNSTRLVGLFGQIVSAITEFLTVLHLFKIDVQNLNFDNAFSDYYNLLAYVTGLSIVYLFEIVGVRSYLVSLVRQLYNKDFKGVERKFILFFNIVIVFALSIANIYMSQLGHESIFIDAKSSIVNHSKIDEKFAKKSDKINKYYDSKIEKQETLYNNKVERITSQSDIAIKELKNSRYASKLAGGTDATYDSYTRKIDARIDNTENKLSQLAANLEKFNAANEKSRQSELNNLKNNVDSHKKNVNKSHDVKSKFNLIIETYTKYILFISIALSWIAIIYNQVFLTGSKIEIKTQKAAAKPNLFIRLFKGLYNRFYHILYIIVSFFDTKNYAYKDTSNEYVVYENKSLFKTIKSELFGNDKDFEFAKQLPQNSLKKDENENRNENRNDTRPIGFKIPKTDAKDVKNTKSTKEQPKAKSTTKSTQTVCKNCGCNYTKNHHKQVYCSTQCRVDFWQKKNGKKLPSYFDK